MKELSREVRPYYDNLTAYTIVFEKGLFVEIIIKQPSIRHVDGEGVGLYVDFEPFIWSAQDRASLGEKSCDVINFEAVVEAVLEDCKKIHEKVWAGEKEWEAIKERYKPDGE